MFGNVNLNASLGRGGQGVLFSTLLLVLTAGRTRPRSRLQLPFGVLPESDRKVVRVSSFVLAAVA